MDNAPPVKKKEIAAEFHIPANTLSTINFKRRHKVTFSSVSGESAFVPQDVVAEWLSETLPQLLMDYAPQDVFNADETGLLWWLLPDKTFSFQVPFQCSLFSDSTPLTTNTAHWTDNRLINDWFTVCVFVCLCCMYCMWVPGRAASWLKATPHYWFPIPILIHLKVINATEKSKVNGWCQRSLQSG